MRFRATCYRAHDPRWSFAPTSGHGAAVHGGRFNPKGLPALYLNLDVLTAIKEINQAFSAKIHPCVVCSYEVHCNDIADLRTDKSRRALNVRFADLDCAWLAIAAQGKEPPSWKVARRLLDEGYAGMLVQSFAPGAEEVDAKLVLWKWGRDRPHQVRVFDPSGRLPKHQLSRK